MGYQIPERLLYCPELLLFSKHHYKLQEQKKNFDLFSLVFYHNHTWMIPKFIASVCNLVISGCGIIIITMISRYFQVWKNTDEKLVKNFCFSLIFCNYFFWNYFLLTFLGDFFFSISVTIDSVFILSVKNCFYRLPKGFVICNVTGINITKEVLLFTPNQTYTEITLLIICLSINVPFCV